MSAPRTQRKTRLVWLARLLLLAIAGLGVLGLDLLRQDRRQATQDAEMLAQSLADLLADESRTAIPRAIEQFTTDFQTARTALFRVALAAPEIETNHSPAVPDFPISRLETLPRVQCFVRDGRSSDPPFDFPETPQPPGWLLTTPRDLIEEWEVIERTALATGKLPDGIAQFQSSLGSARPLHANLQLLFALMADGTDDAKASRLANLGVNPEDTTSAGVPIADVGLYRAVLLADSDQTMGQLLTELVSRRFRAPSFMTERILITLTERVRSNHPALTNRIAAAWTLWEMDQRTRPILEQWREQGQKRADFVNGAPGPQSYFVFSQPSPFILTNITINHQLATAVTNVTSGTDHMVTIIPDSVLEAAVRDIPSTTNSRWPHYLSAELEFLGQRFGLTPWAPGTTHRWDASPIAATKPGSLFGSLGPCPYTVIVRLADPELLYARQRQRLVAFGALIVLVTVIAGIGVWQLQKNLAAQFALNEQKSNFVSSVSHELRAPIASVRLLAESLERGKVSEPAKQHEYFRFIGQECRRLSALIENVLDFSRIEQGRKQYEFEPTDVGALVAQTVNLMQPYATERGVELELRTGGQRNDCQGNKDVDREMSVPHSPDGSGHWELNLDGRAIQQALVNLIDNAIKHSPKDAVVTVGLELGIPSPGLSATLPPSEGERDGVRGNLQPSTLNLSVTDHGPGLPVSEHEKIFERFYRRGSELRRETPGVGIGLSIVKHIVEAHGGRVRVESKAGQGSRFTIELPSNQQEQTEITEGKEK